MRRSAAGCAIAAGPLPAGAGRVGSGTLSTPAGLSRTVVALGAAPPRADAVAPGAVLPTGCPQSGWTSIPVPLVQLLLGVAGMLAA
jgi:hypothetical protein